MSRHLPRGPLIATLAIVAAAIVIFVALNRAFGGPQISVGSTPYRLIAVLPDSQGLVTKSLVMVRGVRVGEVTAIQQQPDGVHVTLSVDRDQTLVYPDAIVRAGRRTPFGEAYISLDPGRRGSGAALPPGATLGRRNVQPVVEVDELFDAVGAPTRRHLRSLARTGAAVAAAPRSAARLNRTLAGLGSTITGLRTLGDQLDGQRENLTSLIAGARDVVDELSTREDQLRTLASAGRASTEALSNDTDALRRGLAETSHLLKTTRATLRDSQPLLREARPVVDGLAAAAPDLARAARRLPAVAAAGDRALRALPAVRRAAIPVLRLVRSTSTAADRALPSLQLALRDLDPALEYLAPYRSEVMSFFGIFSIVRMLLPDGTDRTPTIADVAHQKPFKELGKDAPFGWVRLYADGNIGTTTGTPTGIGTNPYPKPLDPYSHWTGNYPRLTAAPAPAP